MCRRPNRDAPFAGIRECYNRRARDPEFDRLTFCLLGVASPGDLIRDTRTTPFNIGQRIALTDFTETEAAPLAAGLHYPSPCPLPEAERGSALGPDGDSLRASEVTTPSPLRGGGRGRGNADTLLQRILYWTNGHPYLTQRLCRAVSEQLSQPSTEHRASSSTVVDRLCQELFLSHRARERDDNLLFVRDRLLRSEADVASLLSLYARVRAPRQKVPDDETNPLVSLLRLSGVTREREGHLEVRNRIYARVFDRAWVEANLPDAEVRRLRAEAREEARKRRQAEEGQRALRRLLYVANVNVAQQAWELGNVDRASELLASLRPGAGEEDLRGFEWR